MEEKRLHEASGKKEQEFETSGLLRFWVSTKLLQKSSLSTVKDHIRCCITSGMNQYK